MALSMLSLIMIEINKFLSNFNKKTNRLIVKSEAISMNQKIKN